MFQPQKKKARRRVPRPRHMVDATFSFFTEKEQSDAFAAIMNTQEREETEWKGFYKEGIYTGHRHSLLLRTSEFLADLETLDNLVGKTLEFALLGQSMPTRKKKEHYVEGVICLEAGEHDAYQSICRAFERKWRVSTVLNIDGRKARFKGMIFEDSMYPQFPVVLADKVPSQITALAAAYPGRFVVIDTDFLWDEIRPYLEEVAPGRLRKRGKKVRDFDVHDRQQIERDLEMMSANPKTDKDLKPFYDDDDVNADVLLKGLRTRMKKLRKIVAPTTGVVFPPI